VFLLLQSAGEKAVDLGELWKTRGGKSSAQSHSLNFKKWRRGGANLAPIPTDTSTLIGYDQEMTLLKRLALVSSRLILLLCTYALMYRIWSQALKADLVVKWLLTSSNVRMVEVQIPTKVKKNRTK